MYTKVLNRQFSSESCNAIINPIRYDLISKMRNSDYIDYLMPLPSN